jgi:hypothetical protein
VLRKTTDFLLRTVGLVLISSAYFWQFNAIKGSKIHLLQRNSHYTYCVCQVIEVFGIANPKAEKAVLGPATGCRNAAAGIVLLILSLKGDCKLAGTFLFVWVTPVGQEDL